jgi:hypothetical protein
VSDVTLPPWAAAERTAIWAALDRSSERDAVLVLRKGARVLVAVERIDALPPSTRSALARLDLGPLGRWVIVTDVDARTTTVHDFAPHDRPSA